MVPLRSIQRSRTCALFLSCDYYFTSSGCVATCILFILAFTIQTLSSTLTSSFGDHGYSKEIFQSLFAAMAVGFVAQFRYGREEKEIYVPKHTEFTHEHTLTQLNGEEC